MRPKGGRLLCLLGVCPNIHGYSLCRDAYLLSIVIKHARGFLGVQSPKELAIRPLRVYKYNMTITTYQKSGVEIIEVTEKNGKEVHEKVLDLLRGGQKRFVIDLREVSFCSSLDIAQVINARADADEQGGVVRCWHDPLRAQYLPYSQIEAYF